MSGLDNFGFVPTFERLHFDGAFGLPCSLNKTTQPPQLDLSAIFVSFSFCTFNGIPKCGAGSMKFFSHQLRYFVPVIGQAANPGPFVLEIANVTHLIQNLTLILKRKFNCLAISEHNIKGSQLRDARARFGPRYKMHLSKLDDSATYTNGGTGLINQADDPSNLKAPKPKHINVLTPKCPTLKSIVNEGRVGLYSIEVCPNIFVSLYFVYCHTNGDCDAHAATHTNDLMDLILNDMPLHPPGPVIVAGDVNCSLRTIPNITHAINSGKLFDLGAMASKYGGIDFQPTCRANQNCKATRRDYVFANPMAEKLIKHFAVDDNSGLSVHSILRITFHGEPPNTVMTL